MTSELILQAQSREGILAGKMVALAFRENRIKNRDFWDIAWLVQQGLALPSELILANIWDHRREEYEFVSLLQSRFASRKAERRLRADFLNEMRRFLPASTVKLISFELMLQGQDNTWVHAPLLECTLLF